MSARFQFDTGQPSSMDGVRDLIRQRQAKQPLGKPFAYALIRLDGAATPLLHVVDAGSESAMQTGMRVRARRAEQPVSAITDIQAFVPAK